MFGAPVRVDEVGAKHARCNVVKLRIEGLAAPDGLKRNIGVLGGTQGRVPPEAFNMLNSRSSHELSRQDSRAEPFSTRLPHEVTTRSESLSFCWRSHARRHLCRARRLKKEALALKTVTPSSRTTAHGAAACVSRGEARGGVCVCGGGGGGG
eukprot:scaffold45809_cov90-Phaeocystis_antarctica.AAC.3